MSFIIKPDVGSTSTVSDEWVKGDILPCGAFTHSNSYNTITLTADKFYGVCFSSSFS